jgi:hypothetical protein
MEPQFLELTALLTPSSSVTRAAISDILRTIAPSATTKNKKAYRCYKAPTKSTQSQLMPLRNPKTQLNKSPTRACSVSFSSKNLRKEIISFSTKATTTLVASTSFLSPGSCWTVSRLSRFLRTASFCQTSGRVRPTFVFTPTVVHRSPLNSAQSRTSVTSLANILSMAAVRKVCRIAMDTSVEGAMNVHRLDGTIMKFTEYSSGLYYYDSNNPSSTNSRDYLFLNTVAANKLTYTRRKIEGADKARALYKKIGRPSEKDFTEILEHNLIQNCPVTPDDARRALKIYGPTLRH